MSDVAEQLIDQMLERKFVPGQTDPVPPCPNCFGQRELASSTHAQCHFCGKVLPLGHPTATRAGSQPRPPQKESVSEAKFGPGDRVQVEPFVSGIHGGSRGTVLHPRDIPVDHRGVPVLGAGHYKPVKWSEEHPIKLDNGQVITMYKNRLRKG